MVLLLFSEASPAAHSVTFLPSAAQLHSSMHETREAQFVVLGRPRPKRRAGLQLLPTRRLGTGKMSPVATATQVAVSPEVTNGERQDALPTAVLLASQVEVSEVATISRTGLPGAALLQETSPIDSAAPPRPWNVTLPLRRALRQWQQHQKCDIARNRLERGVEVLLLCVHVERWREALRRHALELVSRFRCELYMRNIGARLDALRRWEDYWSARVRLQCLATFSHVQCENRRVWRYLRRAAAERLSWSVRREASGAAQARMAWRRSFHLWRHRLLWLSRTERDMLAFVVRVQLAQRATVHLARAFCKMRSCALRSRAWARRADASEGRGAAMVGRLVNGRDSAGMRSLGREARHDDWPSPGACLPGFVYSPGIGWIATAPPSPPLWQDVYQSRSGGAVRGGAQQPRHPFSSPPRVAATREPLTPRSSPRFSSYGTVCRPASLLISVSQNVSLLIPNVSAVPTVPSIMPLHADDLPARR